MKFYRNLNNFFYIYTTKIQTFIYRFIWEKSLFLTKDNTVKSFLINFLSSTKYIEFWKQILKLVTTNQVEKFYHFRNHCHTKGCVDGIMISDLENAISRQSSNASWGGCVHFVLMLLGKKWIHLFSLEINNKWLGRLGSLAMLRQPVCEG